MWQSGSRIRIKSVSLTFLMLLQQPEKSSCSSLRNWSISVSLHTLNGNLSVSSGFCCVRLGGCCKGFVCAPFVTCKSDLKEGRNCVFCSLSSSLHRTAFLGQVQSSRVQAASLLKYIWIKWCCNAFIYGAGSSGGESKREQVGVRKGGWAGTRRIVGFSLRYTRTAALSAPLWSS